MTESRVPCLYRLWRKKKEKVETTRTTSLPWHKQEMYKKKIDDMPSKSYYAE